MCLFIARFPHSLPTAHNPKSCVSYIDKNTLERGKTLGNGFKPKDFISRIFGTTQQVAEKGRFGEQTSRRG
jgi:hypothetical protein